MASESTPDDDIDAGINAAPTDEEIKKQERERERIARQRARAREMIRLDRSRPVAEVRGERNPDDPHYHVHYQQDGLFFDSNGKLIPDTGEIKNRVVIMDEGTKQERRITYHPLYDDKMRKKVERKIDRLLKNQQQDDEPPAPDEDDEDRDVITEADIEEVNLEAWLRGDVQYPIHMLQKAVEKRYSRKNIWKKADFVRILVDDEELLHESEVDPNLMALVERRQRQSAA